MSVITSPMCDYYLGGKDDFAADRAAAERAVEAFPVPRCGPGGDRVPGGGRQVPGGRGSPAVPRPGCGLTAGDLLHVIAQATAAGSRVVYVDNDRCKSGCAHARRTASKRMSVGCCKCTN
jgi:hypothetical protein